MATGTNTASNVSTGKPKISGGIFRAPIGTALPTDATTDLSNSFESMGYIANGGVTQSFEINSGEYRAWGGDIVLAYQTGKSYRFKFGLVEALNKATYETMYGEANVSGTLNSGLSITANGADMTEYVYVIELALRGGVMARIVLPDGKITESGDVVYKDDDAINFPVTITAQADNSGNSFYEYIKKSGST